MTREELRDQIAMAICMVGCGIAAHRSDYYGEADAVFDALEAAGVRLVLVEADGWRKIDSAPKGNGDQFESVTDPGYIAPPEILVLFEDGNQCVVHWDWYYAPGGYGHDHAQGGPAWVAVAGGELAHLHFGSPTHWRPLPKEPAQ